MKLAGCSTRRSSSTLRDLHCRTLFLILAWVVSLMSYWVFFVHSHSFYHMFFRGLRLADYSGPRDRDRYYNIITKTILNKTLDGHVGKSVAENADRRWAYRNSSVIARAPFTENADRRQVFRNISVIPRAPSENTARRQAYMNSSVITRATSDLEDHEKDSDQSVDTSREKQRNSSACATVEEMGFAFSGRTEEASLRVRKMIQDHFAQHGAARVRELSPEQFCRQNFVFGRTSDAGFGNEMYRILTAAALSLLLNRSLILGENREKLHFVEYIAYSDHSFSLKEIKLLWARNGCATKYKRPLVMRIDDFQRPAQTGVLCEDWREWKQPIVWFQGTTDTTAIQFFLKNIHPGMRDGALMLLGSPRIPSSRPNLFGELMKVIILPTRAVEEAVSWALNGGPDPDITLHMRMRASSSRRALYAAYSCIKNSLRELSHNTARPRVVLVTDTPSVVRHIKKELKEYAEIMHFDYMSYSSKNASEIMSATYFQPSKLRARDWGPMPRWVAFVDFFLASRARHAVISGAHRRVGTTYAQLIAAMAAANKLDETLAYPLNFSFYSSFQSTLLAGGLGNQVGWGHVWNRFGGKLSCHNQTDHCALTPLLPCGWWDGPWQSPILRDIRRLKNYGVDMKDTGEVLETSLLSFCKSRKVPVKTMALQLPSCKKKCQR